MNTQTLYGLDHWETLCADLYDALEMALDEQGDVVDAEEIRETLTKAKWPIVFGEYKRRELPPAEEIAQWCLDHVLEVLDQDHGDPDDDSEPTQAMRDAASIFANVVRMEYTPWICEPTGKVREVTEEEARKILGV